MATQLITLNNMGQSGINSDISAWELGPEFFTYGKNFRVRNGKVLPFGGSVKLYDKPLTPVNSGVLKHVRVAAGDFWVACTRNSVLATADDDVGWFDASSRAYDMPEGFEREWTICQLGQLVIVNNPEVSPEYWVGAAINQQKLLPIPFNENETWLDRGLRCGAMRSHKNFLIAMNMKGSENFPNGYRISHPAVENAIPFTWDTTARDSLAIQGQLGGDGAEILDGQTLRDDFAMYSRDSIDLLTFNPNSEFFWTRRELSSTFGLLTKNCLTEVKGSHFLITDGDIIRNDGSNIKSIIHGRLLRRFNSKVNDSTQLNSFVCRNDILKEIWFAVPEEGSVTPNVAYVYNWRDDSFSIRDLPSTLTFADYGKNPAGGTPELNDVWSAFNKPTDTWDGQSRTWGSARLTALDDELLGLLTDGSLVNIDPKGGIDEAGFNCVVERTSFPLDGHRQTNTVSRVYPHASGGAFKFQLGSQQHVGGPINWTTERKFNPGVDRKIDVLKTGEAFSWRISSDAASRFELSGFDLEYTPSGVR